MSGEQFNADTDRYLQAAALNTAPPQIPSDPLVDGATPIEQLMRVLGLASNSGDLLDDSEGAEGHAQRDTWTTAAAGTFAEQDAGAAAQVNSTAAQQIPQLATGIAGAVAGVVTAVLQPLAQIPQQFTQGAQQVMQSATGLLGQSDNPDAISLDDPGPDAVFGDPVEPAGFGEFSAGSGTGTGGGGTVPSAVLGPAPTPSAGTHPSSSAVAPPVQPSFGTAAPAPAGAMTGVPMMPPAGLAGGAVDSNAKNDTKRVAVPSVRNGSPVQGRISTASSLPVVTTRIDGKPVATRRMGTEEGDVPRPG